MREVKTVRGEEGDVHGEDVITALTDLVLDPQGELDRLQHASLKGGE